MDNWHCPERTEYHMTPIEKVLAALAIAVVIAVCLFGPNWGVH